MSVAVLSAPDDSLRLKRALPVLVLLLMACALAVLGIQQGARPAPHADMKVLPIHLGTWNMIASEQTDPEHLALTSGELGALTLDSYTQRIYQDAKTGRYIQVLIEYRTAGRGAFNHRPEACYPAVGYVLSNRRTVPVIYDGRPASAVAMTADYSGSEGTSHQSLLYWFGSGNRCLSSFWKQQVEMAFGRLQPQNNGWAFVRLVSEIKPGDDAGALAAQQDFVRQTSPAVVATISAQRDH